MLKGTVPGRELEDCFLVKLENMPFVTLVSLAVFLTIFPINEFISGGKTRHFIKNTYQLARVVALLADQCLILIECEF